MFSVYDCNNKPVWDSQHKDTQSIAPLKEITWAVNLALYLTYLWHFWFQHFLKMSEFWIIRNTDWQFFLPQCCVLLLFSFFKLVVFSILIGFCLIWYHGGFILVKLFYPSLVVIFSGIIPNLEFLMSIYCHIILDAFSCGSHLVPSFFHMYTHTIFIWV